MRQSAETKSDQEDHDALDELLNLFRSFRRHWNLAFSVAPGAGRNRGRLYVCYDRVERLYRKQIAGTARGETARSATTAQILGYAMAHEIGHLLGLDAHPDLGIMSVAWGPTDLLNLAYGDLAFTPQQAINHIHLIRPIPPIPIVILLTVASAPFAVESK